MDDDFRCFFLFISSVPLVKVIKALTRKNGYLWVLLDHWIMFSNQKLGFKQQATCRTVKRHAGDLRYEREPEIWSNEEHGYSNQLGISSDGVVTNNLQMLWNPWTKGSYCSSLQCKVSRIRKIQKTSRNTSAHKLIIRNHSASTYNAEYKNCWGNKKKQTHDVDPSSTMWIGNSSWWTSKVPSPSQKITSSSEAMATSFMKKHPTAGSAGSCFSCWLHLQLCLDT